MNNFNNDNISFFLEEKDNNINNEEDIKKMMDEFISLQSETDFKKDINELNTWLDNDNMTYLLQKSNYGNDELFYEQEYNVKELLKICSYYDLGKHVKISKFKKQDIISTIVYFESLPENFEIVEKRNRMWSLMSELLNDQKMKKFVIF
jgi:hypothetical protein